MKVYIRYIHNANASKIIQHRHEIEHVHFLPLVNE